MLEEVMKGQLVHTTQRAEVRRVGYDFLLLKKSVLELNEQILYIHFFPATGCFNSR